LISLFISKSNLAYLLYISLLSILISILTLCYISYMILKFRYPSVLSDDLLTTVASFFFYPGLYAIILNNINTIWIFSIILFSIIQMFLVLLTWK
jgi:magnesium-transporting ATPase (P-type)